jgi:hypothetical protein
MYLPFDEAEYYAELYPTPRTGSWADDFNTYEEACRYYGCDTPSQLAAEDAYYAQLDWIAEQDEIEARGGPAFGTRAGYAGVSFDDLPF